MYLSKLKPVLDLFQWICTIYL